MSKVKHIVIASHPEVDSFTMAVARKYCAAVKAAGQTAVLRDLYRMNFDPILKSSELPAAGPFVPAPDVAEELALLAGAEAFVLVYPIWFGTPPAMIKGYVERVLGSGFKPERIARHLSGPSHPLLGGKMLLSFTSSGATSEWLTEQGAWLSLQTIFDGYLARAFWMNSPDHMHFDSVTHGMEKDRVEACLQRVTLKAEAICAELKGGHDRTGDMVA